MYNNGQRNQERRAEGVDDANSVNRVQSIFGVPAFSSSARHQGEPLEGAMVPLTSVLKR